MLALSSSVAPGTIFWGKSGRRKEAIEFSDLLYITFVIVDGLDCSERIKPEDTSKCASVGNPVFVVLAHSARVTHRAAQLFFFS